MIYQTLAMYYDALVKDEEATEAWLAFVKQHMKGHRILEAACGSGEITIAMAQAGYEVMAGDLSAEMIKYAKKKQGSERIAWSVFDMRDLSAFSTFEGIVCFCDSLNYLLTIEDVTAFFTQAYTHLCDGGVFLFDMHSLDRLTEFEEEYCEAGVLYDTPYEWTIMSEDNVIYQNFAFYDQGSNVHLEQHMQKVYDPNRIKEVLEGIGFQVTVYTDFILPGIQEGEKQFYVCTKE